MIPDDPPEQPLLHDIPVPDILKPLDLYACDPVLCAEWSGIERQARMAYPGLDLEGELARAHSWEFARTTRQRRRNRKRFLINWFARAYDDLRKQGGPLLQSEGFARAPEKQEEVDRDAIRERFGRILGGGDE